MMVSRGSRWSFPFARGWSVEEVGSSGEVNLLLRLTSPDGAVGVLGVEAKRRLAPGAVPSVRAVLEKQTAGTPVSSAAGSAS